MKIYLSNLRDYLFDQTSLDTFRHATHFEFWFCLANIAAPSVRDAFLKNATEAAERLA